MNCDICHRPHHGQKLPFLCAVDARNRLYEGRVAHARVLIENEEIEEKINEFLSRATYSSSHDGAGIAFELEKAKAEEVRAADRTSQIIAQADKLRTEVEAARKEIDERRKKVASRKADLAAASEDITERRNTQVEDIQRAIHATRYRWHKVFESTTATRGFLCMEAARVYGLRRIKKSNTYELGGIEILELPAMINASPEAITTSLAHIAHILSLASHYLAIRLPAEIALPHADYPRPTILSLASSYRHGEVPFPGTVAIPPTGPQDPNPKHTPRPRPLFLEKPLSILARENPSTYSLFIEGVVLLAYNIAWACCTQGVPIGDRTSYEDVCNMGRNLYNLLIGNQLTNNPALRLAQTPDETEAPPELPTDQFGGILKPMMGRWSHGTAHTFLGSAIGNEFLRTFKLPNPVKVADRLRKKMLNDAEGLDWEMLEDEAWAPEEPMEDGVQEGRKPPGDGEPDRRLYENARGSGTSGWTKLKSR
ncbi:hypothetical protein M406DRAFT_62374 [Cryphonectria parasitica EP155]|uniref:Autophagy-related protein 14 n=1 Tax=Cryphonectria parasitica (strain ATCC 38755 / EP155) TaxID=660469 RepID=A0A9P4Y121_CRYP1|nr:uncharacterized protein M406DRAFT_62374 [Cryphonectria parasitica EP155]KAF3764455.1 hypothetical protein M406DRAFT_62374 [Cryphonectria parasitica EP155]